MTAVTAADVERAQGEIVIGPRDVVTPLARDRAKELGIRITVSGASPIPAAKQAPVALPARDNAMPSTPVAKPLARTQSPLRAVPAAPGPNSGALYRRGAPVAPVLHPAPIDTASIAVADTRPRVAVVGAGHVGGMTALRLAECDLFSRVVLADIVPGLADGLALDMWHSAGLRRFTTRVEGTVDLAGVADAEFVVVTAGRARQPGMTRADLTGVNAQIITGVAGAIRAHAPNAVVVVVTNPLEEMTHLMASHTGFAPERVIGMAGVLDTARFCALVGLTGVARPQDVHAFALGSHGPEMVIPLSQASANGVPLEQLLTADTLAGIIERTRGSGAEVVKLLQKGSAYFSPAESAAAMVSAMVLDTGEVQAACVQSQGTYGLVDTRVGLPVRLRRRGVAQIVQLELRPEELSALREAAERIAARIRALG
jgi:malate dehydrogenase